jgi:hypothetical protein
MDGNLILDNNKIATRRKYFLEFLYQKGETANINNKNNSDMQGRGSS